MKAYRVNKVVALVALFKSGFIFCISKDSDMKRSSNKACEDGIPESVSQNGCE